MPGGGEAVTQIGPVTGGGLTVTVGGLTSAGAYLLVRDPYVVAAIGYVVALLAVLIALAVLGLVWLVRGVRAVEAEARYRTIGKELEAWQRGAAEVDARQAEYDAAFARHLAEYDPQKSRGRLSSDV